MRNLTRNAARFAIHALAPLLLALCVSDAGAQEARLNLAVAGLPGVGVMVVQSSPTLFVFSRELAAYGDFTVAGSNRLLVAVGVGGAVQLTRILEIIQNRTLEPVRLDVGMRLGPSFYYGLAGDSADEEARAFRVMFDPFVRGSYATSSGRVLFAEVGAHAPDLRIGVSLGL